ncbi:protein disulfide-isomerase precursor [Gurleya vavrai]
MLIFFSVITSITIRSSLDLSIDMKDVELIHDKNIDKIYIEDDKRQIETENKDHLTEIATLLTKYKSPPAIISEIDSKMVGKEETEEEKLASGKVSFIVFYIKSVSDAKIDARLAKLANIYISSDKNKAEEMQVPFPGVYGFNASDNVTYKIKFSGFMQDISKILTPIFGELTVDNLKLYDDSLLPKFFLFYDEDKAEEFFNNKKEYEEVAKKFKESVKVGILPFKKDKPSLNHFGVGVKDLPVAVCVDEKKKYRGTELNPENLEKLFTEFTEKKLNAYELSSEEVKDNDKRNVKIISRNGYKKYFFLEENDKTEENDKDALIVFTSPHCRFCIDLKPILEKLGEHTNKNAKKEVVIGNIDLTINDFSEFDVRGYPTIVLISNGEIFYYDGNRTIEDLSNFIKEKGKYKIDVLTGKKMKVDFVNDKNIKEEL